MADIALLDGGNGQEIIKRAGKPAHPLWSVEVMLNSPEIITAVHAAFVAAGARVLTLNTYAATPTRMGRNGYGDRFEEAHQTAIRVAREAIAETPTDHPVQIAGCLPPLVASYRADVRRSFDASVVEFGQMVATQAADVDLFLIETMSNLEEARAAVTAAKASGLPVYVALTLSDDGSDTLRSGEPLAEVVHALHPLSPDGILLNCSVPEAITRAMPLLAKAGVPFGGYANGFTSIEALGVDGTVDSLTARTNLTPDVYADFVEQWIAAGATIVGGCCEVGPEHIRVLAARLQAAGHRITGL